MNTGKHKLLDLLEFPNLEQFIIPEIQRDYVWKTTDVLDLLESIKVGFEGGKKDTPFLGFIYAYNNRDYVYKYFLVDGQQRMTTIFLILLACHQIIGKKLPEYLIKNDKLKLDYKVRQETHDFLTALVNHCQIHQKDSKFIITDQVWFHSGYILDKTIYNMVENYNAIVKWLGKFNHVQPIDFLKYIEDNVELSYFDIENGEKGEELYIYMNSRGKQLEPNETLKAKYLANFEIQSEKEKWGREWELWQDFFWEHRINNADADAGFNDFLQMVQIINMCHLNKTTDDINIVSKGKSDIVLDFDLLPKSLDELKIYFEAFKYLVNSEKVISFFKSHENKKDFFSLSSSIDPNRKQIYYLRTLPIIALLANTKINDEEAILRFIRFIYNVSRKENIGKSISDQLPISLRLMIEYGKNKTKDFDVVDFIDYQKGRTSLIDDEEIIKQKLYKTPPLTSTREELENLFWKAEDHPVFSGEINFLLNPYFNENTYQFDLLKYKKTWTVFEKLFNGTKVNYGLISKALLYYGNTWLQNTPYYYYNYNCQDWYSLVRNDSRKHLLNLLEALHGKSINYLDTIIKKKAKDFFNKNKLTSIDSIKSKSELFEQVRILVAVDYYSEKLIWNDCGYIAYDERFSSKDYKGESFFNADKLIYNIPRYIGDGWNGRIIDMMKNVLNDDKKLDEIIKLILLGK